MRGGSGEGAEGIRGKKGEAWGCGEEIREEKKEVDRWERTGGASRGKRTEKKERWRMN